MRLSSLYEYATILAQQEFPAQFVLSLREELSDVERCFLMGLAGEINEERRKTAESEAGGGLVCAP